MSIIYRDESIIAEFKSYDIFGSEGVGIYRLKFRLNYSTQSWPEKRFEFKNAKAEVYVKGASQEYKFLGQAEPEKPLFIVAASNVDNGDIFFTINLNSQQLSLIEDIRRGDDLFFKILILGEALGNSGSWSARDELLIKVNQREWIDALKQMNYGEFLLFEIPLPKDAVHEEIKAAIDLLKQAQNHYLLGNYEDVVSTCRKAIESFNHGRNETEKLSEAVNIYSTNKRNMSKKQRALFIREALRHFTHLAHHVSDTGEAVSFTRNEAGLALGMTAALLSFSLEN